MVWVNRTPLRSLASGASGSLRLRISMPVQYLLIFVLLIEPLLGIICTGVLCVQEFSERASSLPVQAGVDPKYVNNGGLTFAHFYAGTEMQQSQLLKCLNEIEVPMSVIDEEGRHLLQTFETTRNVLRILRTEDWQAPELSERYYWTYCHMLYSVAVRRSGTPFFFWHHVVSDGWH